MVSGWLLARQQDAPATTPAGAGRRRDVPRHAAAGVREAARPALRREPAPAGRVLSRPGGAAAHSVATATILQGKELSFNNIADADAALECVRQFAVAGLRDRQARQSLRRRGCRHAARGLRARLAHRPHFGLRRHHRLQPRARRHHGRGHRRPAVRRGGRGAALQRRGAQRVRRARRTCAARARRSRRAPPARAPSAAASRGGLLVQGRDLGMVDPCRPEGRHPAPSDRGRARRPALRLAGRQVRQVERHRLCAGRRHHRRRRRPDEPGLFESRRQR